MKSFLSRSWVDALLCVAVFLASLLFRLECKRLAGVDVTVGADAPIWGLTALDILLLSPPRVPPLFPATLALTEILGFGVTEGGLLVPMIAGALISPVTYLAVRVAGGSRGGALLAAGLCLVAPDLVGEALIFQPESMTALSFALCALSFLIHGRARAWWSTFVVGLAIAFAALTREHGLLLTLFGSSYLAAFPPRASLSEGQRSSEEDHDASSPLRRYRFARLTAPLVLVLMVHLSPWAIGIRAIHPMWDWPWNDKAGVPLRDLEAIWTGKLTTGMNFGYLRPSVVNEAGPLINRAEAEVVVTEYARALRHLGGVDSLKTMVRLNFRWARAVGADLHTWILVGAVGILLFLWRYRRADVLGVLMLNASILPVFIVWSQRRHVAVLLPVAFIGAGLGWAALESLISSSKIFTPALRQRLLALASIACALALVGLAQLNWGRDQGVHLKHLAELAAPLREEAEAGRKLREMSGPKAMLGGPDRYRAPHSLLSLYARLPFATLNTEVLRGGVPTPHLAWRSFVELDPKQYQVGPGWKKVLTYGDRAIYWYRPDLTGKERECGEGVLVTRPRFLVINMQKYRLRVIPRRKCG